VKTIRVGIVEDLPDVRDGLALLIGDQPGFECCGLWGNMEDALAGIASADVLLADRSLPGMSGTQGAGRLRKLLPTLPVLVLGVYSDDEHQRSISLVCRLAPVDASWRAEAYSTSCVLMQSNLMVT
jgi:DNA-binding NarL/FixJ family response regulator